MTLRMDSFTATILAAICSLLGAKSGTAQCVEGCTAIHVFTGEMAGDQFGWVSNDLGDLDGDGVRDLVLTAPTNDGAGTNAGRIYVYSGASGEEIFRASGQAAFWNLGIDAACAGDVNGDGVDDVIAGAPSGAGNAVVYSGTSRGEGDVLHTFPGEMIGDGFGGRVHGGGDFNGDGVLDMIIGAQNHDANGSNSGRAYIYSGGDYQLICTIDGFGSFDNFGSGVAFVGDMNDDGRDEVLVGAQNDNGGGRAYVFYWNGKNCEQLHAVGPAGAASSFGLWFMNGRYDVNNDGTPDFYVSDFSVNRAHIFSGTDGSLLYELTGDNTGGFGIGRLVRDVNDDGHADMLLAAWAQGDGGASAGKAFLYSGIDGSVIRTYTHNIAGATFGFDANGMNDDVNGDGFDDFLVTAAWDAGQRGTAYIIAGEDYDAKPPLGDLDFDGDVDAVDLIKLLGQWGECFDCDQCSADLDDDCVVGTSDLIILLGNWG